jgi:type I restriction enzyme S subunit
MSTEWSNCLLGDFVNLKRGYDLPHNKRIEGDVPIISSSGVSGSHHEAKVKGPGVVTGRYGTLGEIFFIEGDFWPLNTTLYVQDFKGNDPRFVSYFLKTLNFKHQNVAGAVPGVNRNALHMMRVQRPPLPTQRKIATILSAYDDLIENNTRRIKILEEMAQALYREWFVNFRFPGHENVRMVDSPRGEIPEGWAAKNLGDIAEEVRRGVSPDEIDPETPYIGLEHLPRKSIALSDWGCVKEVNSTKLVFRRGEILFGKIRPYFHKVGVAPIDGVCSSDTIVIYAKSHDYFSIVLASVSSEEFVKHATQTSKGTKMPRADWGVLKNYALFIPPSPLLQIFDRFVRDSVDQIHNMIFQNRTLCSTRDLLLPKLISGELNADTLDLKTEGMTT